MKKHILLIGGRNHTLEKIKKMGLRVTLFQRPSIASLFQIENTERLFVMDYANLKESLALAKTIHELDPFDTVFSFAEYGLWPAARIAQELGLHSNSISPVELTRNKVKMRDLLKEHALGTVHYRKCLSLQDAEDFFLSVFEKPVILKPADGAGSRGVYLVHNRSELEKGWVWASENGLVSSVIAEEYIEGPEFSVESLSLDGKHQIVAITEKITTNFPNFIETGHQQPARLEEKTRDQISDLVLSFLNLIGQVTGPVHTEIRLSVEGPKIIESQTRIGGDQIWEMAEMTSGVDLVSTTLCHLLGLPLPEIKPSTPASAIRFFCHENKKIQRVEGIDEAKNLPGVIRIQCEAKPGDLLGPLKSSNSRQGYVLAVGKTTEEAMENAEQGIRKVRFLFSDLH